MNFQISKTRFVEKYKTKIKFLAGLGVEICHSEVREVLNNWKAFHSKHLISSKFVNLRFWGLKISYQDRVIYFQQGITLKFTKNGLILAYFENFVQIENFVRKTGKRNVGQFKLIVCDQIILNRLTVSL